jgi:transcriptional regulator with XRE-family HTH domain
MTTLNLRKLRLKSGLTLKQIADAAGVSFSAISRIERGGGTRPCKIEGIARAYGVTAEQLTDVIFANHASLAIPPAGGPQMGGASAATSESVTQIEGSL